MLLAPPPGQQYRHTRTRQLVPADGLDLDPDDLDIARAIRDGDLVAPVPTIAADPAAASDGDAIAVKAAKAAKPQE